MKKTMRDTQYLDFIRSRPCSFCGDPTTEPHHAIKHLRGLSQAGMGQKGPDYLAIPMCRECHRKLHDGELATSREELLEICVINLICYIQQLKTPSLVQRVNAAREKDAKGPVSDSNAKGGIVGSHNDDK